MLAERALLVPERRYLAYVRALAVFPQNWCGVYAPHHRSWLDRLEILSIWQRKDLLSLIEGLLYKPALRADLEQLMLAGLDDEGIQARIQATYRTYLEPLVYGAYRSYFLDTSLVPRHELPKLLEIYSDKYARRVAAVDGLQALYHLTGVEAQVDQVKMVTDAVHGAYFKLLELSRLPATQKRSSAMANYTRMLYAGIAVLRELGVATDDLREKFREFRLVRPKTEIIPPLRLIRGAVIGGGFTGEIQDAEDR